MYVSLSLSLSLVHINLHTQQVFRPPLDDYNVLIHLHKRHLPFAHQAVDIMETGSSHKSHDHKRLHPTHLPVVNFNPVQIYLKELEVYGAKLSCSLMIGEFFFEISGSFLRILSIFLRCIWWRIHRCCVEITGLSASVVQGIIIHNNYIA